MAEEQGTLNQTFTVSTGTLNLQVVTRVSSATAPPAAANLDEDGIWAQVFDPATNTLRIVEVI